jgi:hypothetical protein
VEFPFAEMYRHLQKFKNKKIKKRGKNWFKKIPPMIHVCKFLLYCDGNR